MLLKIRRRRPLANFFVGDLRRMFNQQTFLTPRAIALN